MGRGGRGRGRDARSSNRRAQRCVPAPGRGLAQVRRASRVSLKLFQLRGRRALRLQLGAGGRVAFYPSGEWDSEFRIVGGEFPARWVSELLEGCEA